MKKNAWINTQKQRDIGARSAQKLSSLPTYLLEVSNSVLKPCMVLGISISPFLLHVLLFWVCNILLPSQHGKKTKTKKILISSRMTIWWWNAPITHLQRRPLPVEAFQLEMRCVWSLCITTQPPTLLIVPQDCLSNTSCWP